MVNPSLNKKAMERERIKCIIAGLKRFHLTESEIILICLAEQNLNQDVPLDGKTEFILEWIYRQKTAFIRDSVFSFLNQKQQRRSSFMWPATT